MFIHNKKIKITRFIRHGMSINFACSQTKHDVYCSTVNAISNSFRRKTLNFCCIQHQSNITVVRIKQKHVWWCTSKVQIISAKEQAQKVGFLSEILHILICILTGYYIKIKTTKVWTFQKYIPGKLRLIKNGMFKELHTVQKSRNMNRAK